MTTGRSKGIATLLCIAGTIGVVCQQTWGAVLLAVGFVWFVIVRMGQ